MRPLRLLALVALLWSGAGAVNAQDSLQQMVEAENLIQVLGAEDWAFYSDGAGWDEKFQLNLRRTDITFRVSHEVQGQTLEMVLPGDLAAFAGRVCADCIVENAGESFPSILQPGEPLKPLGTGNGNPGQLVQDPVSGAIAIIPSDIAQWILELCESCYGGDTPKGHPKVVYPKTADCKRYPLDPRCGKKFEVDPGSGPYALVGGTNQGATFWAPEAPAEIGHVDTMLYSVDYDLAMDVPLQDGMPLTGDALTQWKLNEAMQYFAGSPNDSQDVRATLVDPVTTFSLPVEVVELAQ